MLDTGLTNELMALDTGLENSVMAAEQEEQYVPTGYSVDQDGNFVNDDMERVYYWVPSSELGDVITRDPSRALFQDSGGYYTEAEIRSAWDADEGMGYLKEQTDWDNYWGYLSERQALIQDGTLFDATGATGAGRDARQDVIQQGGGLRDMGGARGAATAGQNILYEGYSDYYQDFLGQPEQVALMAKYKISPIIQNDDGDVFGWNGSSYTKVVKVDDHNYGAIVGGLIKTFVVSALTAGLGQAAVGYLATMSGSLGSVFNTINNFLYGVPPGPGGTSIAQQAMNRYNTGLIMDAVDEAIRNVDDYTDNEPANDYLESNGRPEGIDAGEYTIYDPLNNLPPGYIYDEVKRMVINQETGEEYGVSPSVWGARVWLPNPEEEDEEEDEEEPKGGGGASTASDSQDTAPSNSSNNGGNDDAYGGDVFARQLHEAIMREGDPNLRGALIREWEEWTGREWSEGVYDDAEPVEPPPPQEPTGYVWDETEGIWKPVYDPNYPDPGDGSYQAGSAPPAAPPKPNPTWVWSAVLGQWVDPAVIDPNTGEPVIASDSNAANSSDGDNAPSTDSTPSDTGDDAVTTGDGNDGAGESGNNGDGVGNDGTGEGDGGDGNGDGSGDGSGTANNQWIDGSGGASNPQWTRLFGQPKFRSRFKQFQTGMFASQPKQLPSPAIQDYSAQRMGLLSQAYKDLS